MYGFRVKLFLLLGGLGLTGLMRFRVQGLLRAEVLGFAWISSWVYAESMLCRRWLKYFSIVH